MLRGLGRLVAVGAALLAGCFTDSSADSGANGGTTGAEVCVEGTSTCPCYPNDTCNAGLECIAGTCFAENCTGGAEDCPCVDSECLGSLQCVAGVCRPPSTSTSASDTMASASSTTDMGSTTSDSTSGPGMGESTGAVAICNVEDADSLCTECAKTACCNSWNDNCAGDGRCESFLQCLEGTGNIESCTLAAMGWPPQYPEFDACFASTDERCGEACRSETSECLDAQPFVTPCIECIAASCCSVLANCWALDGCRCLATCLSGGDPNIDPTATACQAHCADMGAETTDISLLRNCAMNNGCMDPLSGMACL